MFLKTFISVLTTKVGMLVVGLLSAILMARGLGADGRGSLAALMVYPQLLMSLMEGGMRQTATLYIGQQRKSAEQVLGSLILYGGIAGVIGFIICFLIISFWAEINSTIIVTIIVCFVVPVQLSISYVRGYFLGFKKFKNVNKMLLMPKLILLLVLLALYSLDVMEIYNVALAMLMCSLINLLQCVFFIRFSDVGKPVFTISNTFEMFKKGVPYAIGFFLIVANYKLDIIILSYLSTPGETGNYVVATQFGELLWHLPAALVMILMSNSASEKNRQQFSNNIAKVCRVSLFIIIPAAVSLYYVFPLITNYLMGKDFDAVTNIFKYLAPGLVFMVIFKIINADLAGNGAPKYSIFVLFPCVSFNVILNVLLIPEYGAVGAAIASSISYVLTSIAMLYIYKDT